MKVSNIPAYLQDIAWEEALKLGNGYTQKQDFIKHSWVHTMFPWVNTSQGTTFWGDVRLGKWPKQDFSHETYSVW